MRELHIDAVENEMLLILTFIVISRKGEIFVIMCIEGSVPTIPSVMQFKETVFLFLCSIIAFGQCLETSNQEQEIL